VKDTYYEVKMAHFYGTVKGHRGEATRCGAKSSGIRVQAGSYNGGIQVWLFLGDDGQDKYVIEHIAWQGKGINQKIEEGIVGKPHIYDTV
jgi:hypothetical protein